MKGALDEAAELGDREADFELAAEGAAIGGVGVKIGDLAGKIAGVGELADGADESEVRLEVVVRHKVQQAAQGPRVGVERLGDDGALEIFGIDAMLGAVETGESRGRQWGHRNSEIGV